MTKTIDTNAADYIAPKGTMPGNSLANLKATVVAEAKRRQKEDRKLKPKKAKAKKIAKAKRAKPAKTKAAVSPRTDSKQARFITAMRTAKGMSITEAAKEFDWQPHTVRGAIAGAIKKRLGLKVEAEADDKRGTVYRIKK